MSVNETHISKEKKLTLLLLCWLFGFLSIHRFYTGKYLTGGLQLLMLVSAVVLGVLEFEIFWPIPAFVLILWLIVDILRIIMGKFTDKEGKPIIDWV